jgi:hypothetical protein
MIELHPLMLSENTMLTKIKGVRMATIKKVSFAPFRHTNANHLPDAAGSSAIAPDFETTSKHSKHLHSSQQHLPS